MVAGGQAGLVVHTACCTLHTVYCTLNAPHYTLNIEYCTLHIAHYKVHTEHFRVVCKRQAAQIVTDVGDRNNSAITVYTSVSSLNNSIVSIIIAAIVISGNNSLLGCRKRQCDGGKLLKFL